MVQTKILLDSNAYFRLAYNKHPLLFVSFGKEKYTLYVIDDLQKEFDNNPRLQNKFDWVDDSDFVENRKYKLNVSRNDKKQIDLTYSYLWDHNISEVKGASPIDIKALAYGSVLGIPIVTDDAEMEDIAQEFNMEVWGILDLLKLMKNEGHVDEIELKAIVGYLDYINDLPYHGFIEDCEQTFKIKFR